MHLGVIPFHTRVHSSSSQTATRPHAALRGATKTHPGALIVVLSQDTTGPHAAPEGTTKSHPGALIVVSGHYKPICCTWGCHPNTPGCAHRRLVSGHYRVTCRTWGCHQNTPRCAHRRLRTLQGHMLHLGVQPKHTRVRLSSSQDTTGPHAAPGGATKTHQGALIVISGHYKATCRTWEYNQNTPGCNFAGGSESVSVST